MSYSGVAINDEVLQAVTQIKSQHAHRFVIFKMNDDMTEIVLDTTGPKTATYAEFLKHLPSDAPRYALFDYEYTTSEGRHFEKLIYISWSPDNCPTKKKMLHASSTAGLLRKIDATNIQFQGSDFDDVSEEVVRKKLE